MSTLSCEHFGSVEHWLKEPVVVALGRIGPEAAPAVPTLLKHLNEPDACGGYDAWWKVNAVWALGRIGPAAREAVPLLERIVQKVHPGYDARAEAAEALCRITRGEKGLWELRFALDYGYWRDRESICRTLGEIGPAVKAAVPDLEKALKDRDSAVRAAAAEALKKIRGSAPQE